MSRAHRRKQTLKAKHLYTENYGHGPLLPPLTIHLPLPVPSRVGAILYIGWSWWMLVLCDAIPLRMGLELHLTCFLPTSVAT